MKKLAKLSAVLSLLGGFGFTAVSLTSCEDTSITTNTITFSKESLSLYAGDSEKLPFTLSNEDASVTWTTSDKNVATVKRGTVTAKGVGSCTITAEVENGNSASISITVLDRSVSISATTGEINLDNEDKTLQLSATASDGGAITWSSSDTALASVDSNGLVTGHDVGKVIITATRGLASASCEVNIIMPSRPADYYYLTKMTNANVVADPGVWHFHVDGSLNSDYSFEKEPLHQNNSLSVTLGNLNLSNKKYFYFRYQPTFATGSKYTIKYTATATNEMKVNAADGKSATKGKSLKANTPTEITYVGEVNESQPFHISISTCAALDSGTATSLEISNISIVEGDQSGSESDVPEKSEHADETEYNLELMTNANVVNNTGAWYYSCDGTPTVDYTFSETPSYKNGVVTFSFANMVGGKPYNQIRYQPSMPVGTWYKMKFKAVVSAGCELTYGTKVDNDHVYYEKKNVIAGTYEYEFVGQVNNKFPFSINIKADNPEEAISLVVSEIELTQTTAPVVEEDENNYKILKGTKAETIASPGKWFYFADGSAGTDYVLDGDPAVVDGSATLAFSSLPGQKATNQLRYQPDMTVDSKYKMSFTATLSAPGILTYGSEHGETKSYTSHTFETAGSEAFEFKGVVDASVPFSIGIKPNDYNAPISLTISNFTIEEDTSVEPEPEEPEQPEVPPVVDGYDLVFGNKSTTIANPGTWYYMCEGTKGTDFTFVENQNPHYYESSNTVTLPLATMTANKAYQLRYQPNMEVGKEYDVSMKISITASANVLVGKDGATKTVTPTTDAPLEVSYEGVVDASNPFFIQVKPTDYSVPITLTVSDIVFTEKEEGEDVTYTLAKKSNADVCKTPGVWCYMADGSKGTDYSFVDGVDPDYNNGVVTLALATMTSGKTYQLRYQPDMAVGTAYVAKMKVSINAEGYLLYGKEFKKVEPGVNTTVEITYNGTVDASSPFMIQLKPTSYDAPFTLRVSDISFEAAEA